MKEIELTPDQLKEKETSEKEANLIHKEIVYTIKAILVASLFVITMLLFRSIITVLPY